MATAHHLLHWPCPLNRLVETLIDEPLADPGIVIAMKDVKDCRVISSAWEGGKRRVDLAVLLDPPIPAALANLLKPESLGWTQWGVWDPATGIYAVKIEPNTLKNLLRLGMRSHLTDNGDGTSTQDMTLTASCDFPLLGTVMEKFALSRIWESLRNQFDEESPRLTAETAQATKKKMRA